MPGKNTGQLTLKPGPVSVRQPQFVNALSFADGQVLPRTLRLKLRMLDYSVSEEEEQARLGQGLCAGIWWPTAVGNQWLQAINGCMQLRIAGGIERLIYADLREGEFNLPPCSSVQMRVAYWRPGNSGIAEPIELSAEIADGGCFESTPLTFTAAKEFDVFPSNDPIIVTAEQSALCPIPPGAYAFDIAAGRTGIRAVGQTHNLMVDPGGLWVERNPRSGLWVPPTMPTPIGPHRALYIRNTTDSDEGENWFPEVTFYVR